MAGYTAYDDNMFLLRGAHLADNAPDPGMVRFETRDDDRYFYPAVSWRLDEKGTFVKEDKPIGNPEVKASLRDEKQRLQLPAGEGRSSTDWESLSVSLAFNLDLFVTETRQVALYF